MPPPGHHLLHGLDAAQREAVTTTAAPLAVVAAAGSGKTTVLTRRIAHRVFTGSADASHVLALTFTREAAAEMKRRLRRLEVPGRIEAGTFHGVALRLLRDRALTLHRPPPQVAPDRLRLVRECLTELRLGVEPLFAMADLDWARARMVTAHDYESASRAARRRGATPPDRYAHLVAAYTRLKQRRGVVDFDDLLDGVLHAARTDASFADAMRWRFRHLFVDEAQDLNPLQHAVLEALRGGRPDLCLVGDPRQAIYGWNGADHTTLASVEERYPGVTIVRLTANHRCSPQVVRAGAAALASSGLADDSRSTRPDGPDVQVHEYPTAKDEAEAVAATVRSLAHRGGANGVAVLARTNEQLTDIERAVAAAGLRVGRATGRSPLDVALAAASRPFTGDQLAELAERWQTDGSPVERRVAEEIDRYLASADRGGFRAWVEARAAFDDLEPSAEPSVSLLTFHAAKGREWWAVVVTGVEDGLVPHTSAVSAAQREEEARLLYVACTRAAEHLVLTHSRERRGVAVAPSPWLAGIVDATRPEPVGPPPADQVRSSPDPLAPYREWRSGIARIAGVPDAAVCSDRVLRALAADPPVDADDLARRLGISPAAAARLRPLPVRQ